MPVDPFIGEIMMTGWFNLNPVSYVPCKGQLLQISQYQALFSLIGTSFGGDGRTTFGIPDLQGRAPIGTGQGAGLNLVRIGDKVGVPYNYLVEAQMPQHDHTVDIPAQEAPLSGFATGPITASGAEALQTGPTNKWLGQTQTGVSEQIYTNTGTPPATMGMTATVDLSSGSAAIPAQSLITGQVGSSAAINNQSPSIGLSFYMAVDGTYPSRN